MSQGADLRAQRSSAHLSTIKYYPHPHSVASGLQLSYSLTSILSILNDYHKIIIKNCIIYLYNGDQEKQLLFCETECTLNNHYTVPQYFRSEYDCIYFCWLLNYNYFCLYYR